MDIKKLQPMILISGVVAAMSLATIASFASLIFGTTAPNYLVTGIANFMISGVIASIIISVVASRKGVLGGVMDVPTAITAVIASTLASTLIGKGQEAIFANIFAAIVISTGLTGIFMMVLGQFKLGNLVRFIPYPVIAGFLAASGWLLLKGGMNVSGGGNLEIISLGEYINVVEPVKLLLGIGFGVLLLFITVQFSKQITALPLSILISAAIFFMVGHHLGYDSVKLQETGWLLGPIPDEPLWKALVIPDLKFLDFNALTGVLGAIFSIVIISVIQMLLNENGIEFSTHSEIDVNHNLKRFGFVNLLTIPFATPVSFAWLGSTTLAYKMNVLHSLFGVFHGIWLIFFFFIGSTVLSYFPKFIAGGMLVFLGISMILEWLVSTRHSIQKTEYLIVVLIVISVEFFGFLSGISIGLVASIVLFVIRYGKSEVIKKQVDGVYYRSTKSRSIPDQRLLDYLALDINYIQLQGYIFFGSANTLYGKIKTLIEEKKYLQLVLSFKLVSGIDSSAIISFAKISTYLKEKGVGLIIVSPKQEFLKAFEKGGVSEKKYSNLKIFDNFDTAVEFVENTTIEYGRKLIHGNSRGEKVFIDIIYNDMMSALDLQEEFENLIKDIQTYDKVELKESGSYLFRYNDHNRKLYFITKGSLNIHRLVEGGEGSVRIDTLGRWSSLGNVGVFFGLPEPYSAQVEQQVTVHVLDEIAIEKIKNEDIDLWERIKNLGMKMVGLQFVKVIHRV